MTLSSASQVFRGENNIMWKVAPKTHPEEEASRMGPSWGYRVGVVQGKYVTSTLNAPASIPAILMREDA